MDDLLHKFMKFEEENGLLTDTVDGFYYWGYSRFFICERISDLIEKKTFFFRKVEKRSFVELIKDFIKIIPNITIKNPSFGIKKADICFFASPRRVLIDGAYEDIYTDRIAERFVNSVSVEFPYSSPLHFSPCYKRGIYFLDYITAMTAFWSRVPLKSKQTRDAERQLDKKIEEVILKVDKEFGVKLSRDFLNVCFVFNYRNYKLKKKYIRKLLTRISPKVVVEVCHYGLDNMVLNELASEMGIISVELQHGVIGSEHYAYNYLADRDYPFLPQKMFFFSEYWKNTCSFPIGESNKYSVGYPYFERQLEHYPPKAKEPNGTMNVLLLSQPIIGDSFISVTDKLLDLCQNNNVDIRFTLKLHPAEYNNDIKKYEKLLGYENFELINNSKLNLYELFSKSDIQVGYTSTAIYEGLAYNLKTYIFDDEKSSLVMKDIYSSGAVEKFNNGEDLFEKLKAYKDAGNIAETDNTFFEKDALNKMEEKLREILDSVPEK